MNQPKVDIKKEYLVNVVDRQAVPVDKIPAQVGMVTVNNATIIKVNSKSIYIRTMLTDGYDKEYPYEQKITHRVSISKTEARKWKWKGR